MNSFFKKIALVLAFAMVFTAMPISVFAADCSNGHTYNNGRYDCSQSTTQHFKVCDVCYAPDATGENHTPNEDGCCAVCKVPVDSTGTHNHTYNTNYDWSTEEQSHRHACDSCGYADKEELHTDTTPFDNKCDVCGVTVANDGNNNYVHTHKFTVVNKDNNSHWSSCDDAKCMQTDNWQEHADPDGDGYCDCGYEFCTHPAPRTDSEGNIEFGVGPHGHNYYCAVCGEAYGAEAHTPGNEYCRVEDGNGNDIGHSAVCTVCEAPTAEVTAHIPSGEWGSDDDYHFEICSVCYNEIAGTKELHVQSENWGPYDETHHAASCGTCGAEMAAIKEAHTTPNEDGVCSKCYIPVDANGIHTHEIQNVWCVEWIEHVKRCETCGRAVEMGFHTEANNDKKCDVCNAPVEALTEDGIVIDYVHEHQPSGVWVLEDEFFHVMKCSTCGENADALYHQDDDNNGICDVCGVVYVVKIMEPVNDEYRTEAVELDDDYINSITDQNIVAQLMAEFDEIVAVSGENYVGIYDISCYNKATGDKVAEPNAKFVFTITLPTCVVEIPEGQIINWIMYRYHNGVVEKLPIKDNGNGIGSFESDKFSLYVLGYEFVSATHNHIWGYNTQYDAAAHWDYCHVCGEKGVFVPHSYKDGICICGWKNTTTANRTNPATGVTAEMLG